MNSAQVRAKARMAMKRREEQIEHEEMEAGELNLVPYLDIVTNVMLFLLATISSGIILGNINSALPEYSQTEGGGSTSDLEQEEPPLQMTVYLTAESLRFLSTPGLEGSLDKPLIELRRDVPPVARDPKEPKLLSDFDYAKLTLSAQGVITRRWKGKPPLSVKADATGEEKPVCLDAKGAEAPKTACRPKAATEVILVVDATVPYHIIVSTMDALRQNLDPKGAYPDNLLFPDVIFATGIK